MIRKIDSNIFSLTILKVTTFSRIRQTANIETNQQQKSDYKQVTTGGKFYSKGVNSIIKTRLKKQFIPHLEKIYPTNSRKTSTFALVK